MKLLCGPTCDQQKLVAHIRFVTALLGSVGNVLQVVQGKGSRRRRELLSTYVVRNDKGSEVATIESDRWDPGKEAVYFTSGGDYVAVVWAMPGWSVIDESADRTGGKGASF